jgi:hypothetical protein
MSLGLWCINWTESERGYGQRPDGHTLHLTKDDAEQFIAEYWDKQPKGYAPDCYSFPETPKFVEATSQQVKHVKRKGFIWGDMTRNR